MLWSNVTPVPLSVQKHPPNPYDTNKNSTYIPHRWPPLRAHPPSKGLQQTVGVVNSTPNRPTVGLVPLVLCFRVGAYSGVFIVLYGGADLLLYVEGHAVSAVLHVRVFELGALVLLDGCIHLHHCPRVSLPPRKVARRAPPDARYGYPQSSNNVSIPLVFARVAGSRCPSNGFALRSATCP